MAPSLLAAENRAVPVAVAKAIASSAAGSESFVGSIVSPRRVQLAPRVNGQIATMRVDEGARVAAGDALFGLDARLAEIAVKVALASQAEARAELSDAQRQAAEAERLIKQNYVPQTTLDSARALVAVRTATLARRQAELARERELLARHSMAAPFAGAIVSKSAELGQWVTTGDPVFELAALDPLRVVVPVPQRLFTQLQPNAGVMIRVDALAGGAIQSQVTARIPNTNTASRTFPVWVALPNPDGQFIPGMSARLEFQLGGGPAGIAVPNDAIVRRARGGVVVWKVEESDVGGLTVKPVPIQPGRLVGEHTEIAPSGIAVGDLLVVRGNESLRPNLAVRLSGSG